MEYKITCLMCEGYGIDRDIPESECLSCLGDGYIEVSKAEFDEYNKSIRRENEL